MTPAPHNLGDILRRILLVRAADIAAALEAKGEHQRLGEALIAAGAITEEELRVALELQVGLRSEAVDAQVEASKRIADLATANAARP